MHPFELCFSRSLKTIALHNHLRIVALRGSTLTMAAECSLSTVHQPALEWRGLAVREHLGDVDTDAAHGFAELETEADVRVWESAVARAAPRLFTELNENQAEALLMNTAATRGVVAAFLSHIPVGLGPIQLREELRRRFPGGSQVIGRLSAMQPISGDPIFFEIAAMMIAGYSLEVEGHPVVLSADRACMQCVAWRMCLLVDALMQRFKIFRLEC